MDSINITLLGKHQIETVLRAEHQEIAAGRLKEDNPYDDSNQFKTFCEACRRGDLKLCQEKIQEGVNINARDNFDNTPLILASLCGRYEVVQLLLEAGALCERDTFQGERCLYNALNNRIRNLLLSYDYSKSINPTQPLAAHISSLLSREHPKTADIKIIAANQSFHLHKFILSARSPYFSKRLALKPETTSWTLSQSLPFRSFYTSIRFLYLGEVGADLGDGEEEQAVLKGIDKLGRQLEIPHLFEGILACEDRRLARQLRSDEIKRGLTQMRDWVKNNIVKNKLRVDTAHASSVKWDRSNSVFADVLLRADEEEAEVGLEELSDRKAVSNDIPIGPARDPLTTSRMSKHNHKSILFPTHKAMLIRSKYFSIMFSSDFREAQETPYLQIITVDFSPPVLEIVLTFLYTETVDIPLDLAIETVYAADMLCLDKLKMKAAVIVSTLGDNTTPPGKGGKAKRKTKINLEVASSSNDAMNIYDVIRAGWQTRLPRLEEFSARYIANRLENFIDEEEFVELVMESAERINDRQETDTIELIDDIRYYLSERFRLRFEDIGYGVLNDTSESQKQPTPSGDDVQVQGTQGVVDDCRVLDDGPVTDEIAQGAEKYKMLMAKIDALLERLELDA